MKASLIDISTLKKGFLTGWIHVLNIDWKLKFTRCWLKMKHCQLISSLRVFLFLTIAFALHPFPPSRKGQPSVSIPTQGMSIQVTQTVDWVMLATPGLFQTTSSSTVSPLLTKQGGPLSPSHLKSWLKGYVDLLLHPTISALCEFVANNLLSNSKKCDWPLSHFHFHILSSKFLPDNLPICTTAMINISSSCAVCTRWKIRLNFCSEFT